mmetsp:Transcript_25171/g.49191  ORF Transcript_25171/g.49191 Transcript_25171/m.49191 type:complete len:80 (+) Transcript_25171:347-586(+)
MCNSFVLIVPSFPSSSARSDLSARVAQKIRLNPKKKGRETFADRLIERIFIRFLFPVRIAVRSCSSRLHVCWRLLFFLT